MADYTISELEKWDERIKEIVAEEGLDTYPQEFEICDFNEMLAYEAYAGMPSHYPHWSFGKAYERKRTLYQLGIVGLPYEMVINSNPTLAYLMRDNTLLLQILTIAHVYAHNDFFKNNYLFAETHPEYTIEKFKAHADRIRSYIEDPSIGAEKVEWILDAAHALQFQCRRAKKIKKLSIEEQKKRLIEKSRPRHDPFSSIHKREKFEPPDLNRLPLEPEEDILLFIRDYNPYLEEWEKDILTIVVEEANYFLPQIETKIMNEGWASYWHDTLFRNDNRIKGHETSFAKINAKVTSINRIGLNPYAIGLRLFQYIENQANKGRLNYDYQKIKDIEQRKQYNKNTNKGKEFIFDIRKHFSDFTLLNTFIDQEFTDTYNLFVVGKRLNPQKRIYEYYIKSKKTDDYKQMIINSLYHPPQIKVNTKKTNDKNLYLTHQFEYKQLIKDFIPDTLIGIEYLWGGQVQLETTEIYKKKKAGEQNKTYEYKRVLYTIKDKKISKKDL